jgi:hypothetical protein
LFFKNPVAQNRSAVLSQDLEAQRRYGVKIRGLNTSGRLENSTVRIMTLHTPAFSLFDPAHLKAPISDDTSYAEQLMAYYWASRAIDYLKPRTGIQPFAARPLKIYVDDSFTGYSSRGHSLHLEKRAGRISKAFSAEVILQLMGQAVADDLSQAKLFERSQSAQHKFCRLDPRGCCVSANGCAGALAGAFGDYFAAVLFPSVPMIGETLGSDTEGQKICGLTRAPAQLILKTRAQVYSACASAPGNAVLMGSWYAALWWSIRAQSEGLDGAADIDTLFFETAKEWNSGSVFADHKTKALEVAAAYKGGKYLSIIQKSFTDAGL